MLTLTHAQCAPHLTHIQHVRSPGTCANPLCTSRACQTVTVTVCASVQGDPADRALRNKLQAQSAEGPEEEPAAGDESDEPAADAAGSSEPAP